MKILAVLFIVLLVIAGTVSAYYCVNNSDNEQVKEFKTNINTLALKEDIMNNNITKKSLAIKLKYFNRCD